MAGYIRQDINGTSPLDMKNLNDNMRYLWMKVFGDINMSDIQTDIKNILYTNWLQPQGEGNLDTSHPLYIRFFIPPNTKEIKSAKLNVMISRYRVDSDVTSTSPQTTVTSTTTSGASSSSSSGASTNTSSSSNGGFNIAITTPPASDYDKNNSDPVTTNSSPTPVDGSNHNHYLPNEMLAMIYNHTHSFNVSASSHYHNIDHNHNIDHTHQVQASITIDSHSHSLNMGIKEASTAPDGIKCYVNDLDTNINLSGDSGVLNDIDIKDKLTIGSWNIIEFTALNVSRVTAYGIIELLQDY